MKGYMRTAVLAACMLLAAPASPDAAKLKGKKHYWIAHRHQPVWFRGCPVHRNAEGDLIDCQGWRYRDNAAGWDNTCFNLDYLPSMFACSSGGSR